MAKGHFLVTFIYHLTIFLQAMHNTVLFCHYASAWAYRGTDSAPCAFVAVNMRKTVCNLYCLVFTLFFAPFAAYARFHAYSYCFSACILISAANNNIRVCRQNRYYAARAFGGASAAALAYIRINACDAIMNRYGVQAAFFNAITES